MYQKLIRSGWIPILLVILGVTIFLGYHLKDFIIDSGTSVLLDDGDPDLAHDFIDASISAEAGIDKEGLGALVATAVRMLDNAISISRFPLGAQREEAIAKRRIGLGVTGLADALIMCRLYG